MFLDFTVTDLTKQTVQMIHGQRKLMNRLSIYSPNTDEISTLSKEMMAATTGCDIMQ